MIATVALGLAITALILAGLIAWRWFAWRRDGAAGNLLAQQLYVDRRLEQLTADTLQAMREAVRRASGSRP